MSQSAALGSSNVPLQQGSYSSELLISQLLPPYYRAADSKRIFHGANTVAVSSQAGLSATTPALTLYNPSTSKVNLVLIDVSASINAVPAAAGTIMLAVNAANAAAPTVTTSATVKNAVIDDASYTNIGQCYRICTLATAPLMIKPIRSIQMSTAVGVTYSDPVTKIDGQIVIAPGVALSIQSSAAYSLLCSFTWVEVPI